MSSHDACVGDDSLQAMAERARDGFQHLVSTMSSTVTDLRHISSLRGLALPTEEKARVAGIYKSVADQVSACECTSKELEAFVSEEEKSLEAIRLVLEAARSMRDRTADVVSRLPQRLPGDVSSAGAGSVGAAAQPSSSSTRRKPLADVCDKSAASRANCAAGTGPRKVAIKRPGAGAGAGAGGGAGDSADGASCAAAPAKRSRRASPAAPTIAYAMQSELDGVPRYVKGRVNIETLNGAVDELNAIISAKYKLLGRPLTKLRGTSVKKYTLYSEQESAETIGKYFFADTDVKASEKIKADATGKAMIQTLCHIGRIKMVPAKGIVRYFVST